MLIHLTGIYSRFLSSFSFPLSFTFRTIPVHNFDIGKTISAARDRTRDSSDEESLWDRWAMQRPLLVVNSFSLDINFYISRGDTTSSFKARTPSHRKWLNNCGEIFSANWSGQSNVGEVVVRASVELTIYIWTTNNTSFSRYLLGIVCCV